MSDDTIEQMSASLTRIDQRIDDLIADRDRLKVAARCALGTLEDMGAPPIQMGTLCEEQAYDTSVRLLRAALTPPQS
jgi:hypothetical protein